MLCCLACALHHRMCSLHGSFERKLGCLVRLAKLGGGRCRHWRLDSTWPLELPAQHLRASVV